MFAWRAWEAILPARFAPDDNDGLDELRRRWYLSGLEGSDEGEELVSKESLERAPLDCRGRIEGSEIVAMAFCVRSKAAAAKEKRLVEERLFNLETEEAVCR